MLVLAALPIAARAGNGGAARNGNDSTQAASSQPPASAATIRTLREADRLFAQGHYAEVRKLIAPLLKMAHPHPEALFLSGRLHLVHRQWTAAANDFRRMLQVNPNLPRVRLELARALYLAGDYQAAEYHFLLLTGQHLPSQVLKNVQYFLKQIREKAGYWGASVAIVPDTNANQATSAQTVVIDGQTFTLLDNARQKSGVGLYVSAQGRRNFGSGLRNYVRGYTQL
ncbi:MAG TPA: tetratricopeptide repeat protein, partial [Burkholderiales bacterium]|nr:tetratricopeptide repeat protein [Burkholderiales bacterium]